MKEMLKLSPKSVNSDTIQQSCNLDPEFSSFCLIPRNTNSHSTTRDSESSAVSPLFSRARSYQKSSRSRISGESYRSKGGGKTNSIGSTGSISGKRRIDTDWNDAQQSELSGLSSYTTTQRHGVDPPRPAREGMEWVWFPEGYWAERERVELKPKKSGSPTKKWFSKTPARNDSGSTQKESSKTLPLAPADDLPRLHLQGSRRSTDASEKASSKGSDNESRLSRLRLGFNYMSPTYPHFISPSGEPEGLYCKTKRNVEGRFVQRPKVSLEDSRSGSAQGLASQTTMVLEGASSYFERVQRERNLRHGTQLSSATPVSPASPGSRSRRFGLAPWHRKTSHESLFSVTSSIHKLLMGRTPVATPNSTGTYIDREGRSFPNVEISETDHHATNFLPSEARRINTPPMSSETPGVRNRGFFFDLSPGTDDSRPDSANTNNSRESNTTKDKLATSSREWWDGDARQLNSPSRLTGVITPKILDEHGPPPISQFELNLPEHLPNSPLCPKNPKHKSGGTGICVYHGRKRSVGLKRRADTPDSSKGLYDP